MSARRLLRIAGVAFVALATIVAAGHAQDELQQQLQQGIQYLQQNQPAQALEVFDALLEAAETYWPAHFYRGMALGSLAMGGAEPDLERLAEARQAFLRATELNPGFPQGHQFVAISSMQLGDPEMSWEHAILAHRAGVDMTQHFDQLRQVSEEPPDLEQRLNVVRVFVGDFDLSDTQTNDELREAVSQRQGELFTIKQELTGALAASDNMAVVQNPEAADLTAVIKVRMLDEDDGLEGDLQLFDPDGEQAWRRRVQIRSYRVGDITSVFRQMVQYIEEFLAERG